MYGMLAVCALDTAHFEASAVQRKESRNSDKEKAEAGIDSGDPESLSPEVMVVWWELSHPTGARGRRKADSLNSPE